MKHIEQLPRFLGFPLATLFLLVLAWICYRRPVPDDFDRYIYEAIVRGESQPLEVVYGIVKHENRRAEESSVLDSPQHLRELEPMYAIRPLYVKAISAVSAILPIQKAINFISAASLFGIGIIVLCWTKKPLQSALLMAAYPVLTIGRLGTPDALAAVLAISGLWSVEQEHQRPLGLGILFVSLGVRPDNVLLLLAVLAWLVWEKRTGVYVAGLLAVLAIGVVFGINRWAGDYGWVVLFRYSFVGGRYPAQIPHTLRLAEYFSALVRGAAVIFSHLSIWLLLGILAWLRRRDSLLLITAVAVVTHFFLYPSPEDRYLIWAYIIAGVQLIRPFADRGISISPATAGKLST